MKVRIIHTRAVVRFSNLGVLLVIDCPFSFLSSETLNSGDANVPSAPPAPLTTALHTNSNYGERIQKLRNIAT